MRRYTILLALLLLFMTAAPAFAETWDSGLGKAGFEIGIICVASYDDYTSIVRQDGDAMQPRDSEARWLVHDCQTFDRQQVVNFYRYARGMDIAPDDVVVRYRMCSGRDDCGGAP